jgi:hypothetical protein
MPVNLRNSRTMRKLLGRAAWSFGRSAIDRAGGGSAGEA